MAWTGGKVYDNRRDASNKREKVESRRKNWHYGRVPCKNVGVICYRQLGTPIELWNHDKMKLWW